MLNLFFIKIWVTLPNLILIWNTEVSNQLYKTDTYYFYTPNAYVIIF